MNSRKGPHSRYVRIKTAMDSVIRQQQAGFRKEHSCCEHIFALRQLENVSKPSDREVRSATKVITNLPELDVVETLNGVEASAVEREIQPANDLLE